MFTERDVWNAEEAKADAQALLAMFYFRRILDHQALSLSIRHFRPLKQFFEATERELKAFFALHRHLRGYVDASQLVSPKQRESAWRYFERQADALRGPFKGRLLMDLHPDFPRQLARSRFTADWLFCHPREPRDLPRPIVAIVGSRQSTRHQLDVAAEVAEAVGTLGGTVITGLATGADVAAHQSARDTEASLVAVLGSGLARVYPPNHIGLVDELLGGRGFVLTEVPPDYSANADAFVMRNRIVAALAQVVVAVSGKYASGTSHTMRFAADARVPIVSVDPSPNSGISELVRELGGEVITAAQFTSRLNREDS